MSGEERVWVWVWVWVWVCVLSRWVVVVSGVFVFWRSC